MLQAGFEPAQNLSSGFKDDSFIKAGAGHIEWGGVSGVKNFLLDTITKK